MGLAFLRAIFRKTRPMRERWPQVAGATYSQGSCLALASRSAFICRNRLIPMPTQAFPPANDDGASVCWVDALIGNAVRQRRVELGMGQGELAAKVGAPMSYVERYESGLWRIPSATLIRLADALQSPLKEFLEAI